MPLYEYECSKCHKIFEDMASMADRVKPAVCPDCGGEAVRIVSTKPVPVMECWKPGYAKMRTCDLHDGERPKSWDNQ